MTDTKSVKVLKKEEVEKGNFGTVVELPYVQVVDEEAEANTQEVTVKLPNETKVTITKIAHSANKESFLVQSIVVKNHILKDLGLIAEAEGHEKEMKKVQADIDKYYQPEEADQDQRTQATEVRQGSGSLCQVGEVTQGSGQEDVRHFLVFHP
jgi:hypothetical protein